MNYLIRHNCKAILHTYAHRLYFRGGPTCFRQSKISDFKLCTKEVKQADCYIDSSEEIIFYWEFSSLSVSSEQEVFEIQVADNVNFEIPAIDSGEIISKDNNFPIQSDFLENNKEYFWRVRVKDNKNYWSDWVISENSFRLSPSCLNN